LKYLLSQSDIFGHFGVGRQYKEEAEKKAENKKTDRRSRGTTEEELDEDEKAMAHEIGDDEDGDGEVENKQTVLLKQPSIISHGQLRYHLH
jgi:hypothetical protein